MAIVSFLLPLVSRSPDPLPASIAQEGRAVLRNRGKGLATRD